MHVSKFMARHIPVIPEDNNVVEYSSGGMFLVDLKRRARAVAGLRGVANADTMPLDLNALQHAERKIVDGYKGKFSVDEHIVAEHAVFVADESCYWNRK
ncbi:hypothetical protein D3C81_229790 [compost metagenome]